MSSSPDLRVQVPPEQSTPTTQALSEDSGGSSTSKWSRYLQSPSLFMERTASFTVKIAEGMGMKRSASSAMHTARSAGEIPRTRTSVNPNERAAWDAAYRTTLELREQEERQQDLISPSASVTDLTSKKKKQRRGRKSDQNSKDAVRIIHYHPQAGDHHTASHITETNKVVTSKYNLITFLPIFLFEMFSRVAYLYFLIQAGLSWWSVVSPYSGIGSTLALLFVLIVAGVKAIWEDMKRHQEDQRMNTSITHRLRPDGTVEDILWTDVQVGDAIVVRDGENFPADLICLRSALPDNVCFIRTTNLDGETNLKIRKPLDLKNAVGVMSLQDVTHLDIILKAEPPNKNLHKFKGSAVIRNESYRSMPLSPGSSKMLWEEDPSKPPEKPSVEVAVTMNEMLLRGCTLKNSGEIVGLVVYTGKHSRIQMNATKTPLKVGSFDRFLNFQITLVILMQLCMCLFLAVANYIWQKNVGINHPYLALTIAVEGIYTNGFVQIVINFLTFWILLSYLVPISLFVTLEIVKFWQGFVFINFDKDMKDPVTEEHARCRNSNLNEDLGKVEYIFSDKTGTLTSNEMQLRQLSIKGQVLGSSSFRLEDHDELQGMDALKRFDVRLWRAAKAVGGSPAWNSLVVSGGSKQNVMAYHHSNPSHGTADTLGILQRNVNLDDFDPGLPDDGSMVDTVSMVKKDKAAVVRSALTLGHHMVDFFTNICLCQSLILEPSSDGQGQAVYQGPSPDEVALVDAARQMGFEFKNRAQTSITLSMLGKEVVYEVLNVMEYSSERGCMSVIARSPDGTVRLYCKGADTKVMKKLRTTTDPELLARTNDDLHTFAKQGLRTLVIGSKMIPEKVYTDWDNRYQEASRLFEGRDQAMDALGNEIERDLELIGVTAIEDKLQDGVPEAIKTLLDANIRVWMITGDKQETAVNIAVSCSLVQNVDEVMMLNVDEKSDDAAGHAAQLLTDCINTLCKKYHATTGIHATSIEQIPDTWRHGELAVDGPTLNFILADDSMRQQLAQLAARCSGVVVSRSSPSQKAAIVKNMSEYEQKMAAGNSRGFIRWYRRYRQRLRGKMLSIGDGANDVAMIQTADVGVGIMGKEGRQAVNNSDYAFSQFRFLVPLLLVHGNLSHYRLARLIKYSFYKNITFAFVMFYYQFYNGYSGQALVDSITAAFFNVVFTSLPILLFAVLDRPVNSLHAFIQYPQLYDKRKSRSLTTASFWKSGVLQGIIHGAITYFIPYYAVTTSGTHNITDVYSLGRVTFVALIGTVTLEVALIARYWTWVFFWITVLSYGLVYPYMVIFPWIEIGLKYYDPANIGVSYAVLRNPSFWFIIIVCYIITFGTRFAERTWQWLFKPHDSMILAELEAQAESKGRGLMYGVTAATRLRLMALGALDKSFKSAGSMELGRGGGGMMTGTSSRSTSSHALSGLENGGAVAGSRKVVDTGVRATTSTESVSGAEATDGSVHSDMNQTTLSEGGGSQVDSVKEWDRRLQN